MDEEAAREIYDLTATYSYGDQTYLHGIDGVVVDPLWSHQKDLPEGSLPNDLVSA